MRRGGLRSATIKTKPMKTCSSCGTIKPLTEYGRNSCKPDGLCAACKVCRNQRRKNYYYKNREIEVLKSRLWNIENPEKVKANKRSAYLKNRERILEDARNRYWADPDKYRQSMADWRASNRDICSAISASKRAAKLKRTPIWLTAEDRSEIRAFYWAAQQLSRETGIPHHVDHILPLQGEFISGLHVPSNLQILTAFENISKGNTWAP